MEDDIKIMKLWIIHNPSGVCIFEQTFNELPGNVDSMVVTCYLFAILTLSKEITKQQIDFIQLKNIRITYYISKQYVICIIAKNEINYGQTVQILRLLQKKFHERYKSYFEQRDFDGDVTHFKNFAEEVEKLFNRETKYFKFMQKRSEQLKNFFHSTDSNWNNLKDSLQTRAREFGKWTIKHKMGLDNNVQKNLLTSRKRSEIKAKDEPIKKDNQNQKKGWV